MSRRNKLIVLILLLSLECVLMFWCRNRYMTVLSEGAVYESPASVDFKPDFAESNYLSVYIPVTSAVWVGKNAPDKGQTIYLIPGKNVDGMLFIRRASDVKPVGEYLAVTAKGYMYGRVSFDFPASRVYMTSGQMKKLSVLELTERVQVKEGTGKDDKTRTQLKNRITAIIRIDDGHAVIERLLCNGAPVELAYTTVGTNVHITYSNGQTDKDVVTTEGTDIEDVSQPEVSGNRESWLDKLI